MGLAAVQLARIAGARVITTVGSAEKAERIKAMGAHAVVNYKQQDFVAEAQKFTDKKGVDVIIENVAADNMAKDFMAVAPFGRIIVIGTGTGKAADASFPVFMALMKDVSMLGMSLINAGAAIPETRTVPLTLAEPAVHAAAPPGPQLVKLKESFVGGSPPDERLTSTL